MATTRRKQLFYRRLFAVGTGVWLAGFLILALRVDLTYRVSATELQSVNIFPSMAEGSGWSNVDASRIQHLSGDSPLADFTTENSAFIISGLALPADANSSNQMFIPAGLQPLTNEESTSQSSPAPEPVDSPLPDPPPVTAESPPPEMGPSPTPDATADVIPPSATPEVSPVPSNVEGASPEPTPIPDVTTAPEPTPPVIIEEQPVSFFRLLWNSVARADEGGGLESVNDPGSAWIDFSGFDVTGVFEEQPVKNAQIRLSFAGFSRMLPDMPAASSSFISVTYSYQGQWREAGTISLSEEVSNYTNGGYFLYAFPVIGSWDDLADVKIRLTYHGNDNMSDEVYVDGVWLEIGTEGTSDLPESPEVEAVEEEEDTEPEFELALMSDQESFTLEDTPVFNFRYHRDKGFFELIAYLFLKFFHLGNTGMTVQITDSVTGEHADVVYDDGGQFSVRMGATRTVKPGRHRLQMTIIDNGREYYSEKDFVWGGVIANLDKARYRTGQTAVVGIGILNDGGTTMCEANILARVTAPNGSTRDFSTDDGSVKSSDLCNPDVETSVPDFSFSYVVPNLAGQYTVEIIARTVNGPRSVTNTFEVFESVPLNITRHGSMRAIPGSDSTMRFTVVAPEGGFSGPIEERVPSRFQIFQPSEGVLRYSSVREEADSRVILWEVNLEPGESREIGYNLRIPDESPALHLVGPLRVHDIEEAWLWQISVDGPMPDSKTTAQDTVLHSCKADPFSQPITANTNAVFPIKLTPSLPGTPFTVSLGSMPDGILGRVLPADGVAAQETIVQAEFYAKPDIRKGSVSLVVTYEERRKDGRIEPAYCQLNLMIK